MDINMTLVGQMITFVIFIWFTMKYVWPAITKAMDEREKKIADGLAAAEKGQRDLELAKHKSVEILQEAKLEASRIIDVANQRSLRIVEEAKEHARNEGKRIIAHAEEDISQQKTAAKRELQNNAINLAVQMAEKLLQRDVDKASHEKILQNLIDQQG